MRVCLIIVCLGLSGSVFATEKLEPLFKQYCISCHGEDKQKGDVRLDHIGQIDSELWATIYDQLASEEMPPDNKAQPSDEELRHAMAESLQLATLGSQTLAPGFRRLNKREYSNTMRDLLGLRKGTFDPGEYIYDDEIDEGFDTEAESLVISNELLLEYMGAATKTLRHALFSDSTTRPKTVTTKVNLQKAKGTSGRYVNHSKDYVITRSGGKAKVYDGGKDRSMTYPGRYTITVTASGVDRDRYPVKFVPAEGPLVMGFGVLPDGMEALSGKAVLLKSWELKDNIEQTFTFDTWIDKGHFPYFSFVNGSSKPITQIRSNIRRRKLPASAQKQPFVGPGIKISQFKIEGPFHDQWPPESFRATYDSETIPDLSKQKVRAELLHRFAKRAFRRKVEAGELTPYLEYLQGQYALTKDWHESTINTLAAMLSSADFLYIKEGQGELNSYELASRLSYFLWSTMPDAELFELAESGKITDPEVLNQQVDRLLSDPRSNQFTTSFADQWLALDTLGSMPPDGKGEFRIYYRNKLESSMLAETRKYFSYILNENRSVNEFLNSDYSFINRGLAELYGVPFEGGNELVKVTFPAGSKRGGLLGHGSILALTSNGVETSPVVRGHWVLDELLGTPPPPAPKEVPALVPDLNGTTNVREQLERHRTDKSCYECHRQMDPLGMALEAYDPIGRLRTNYSKTQPVTTYGNYKGQDFNDIEQLKKIMLTDTKPFSRNLIIRIAEYGKGRKLHPADFMVVENIVDKLARQDFRLRDIVKSVATGELMRNR